MVYLRSYKSWDKVPKEHRTRCLGLTLKNGQMRDYAHSGLASWICIAFLNGTPVGWGLLARQYRGGRPLQVLQLYVKRSMRRRGIGARIAAKALERSRRLGFIPDTQLARSFFKSQFGARRTLNNWEHIKGDYEE